MSDTPTYDVMTYDAVTGEVTYRAFTEEEAAEDAARAQTQQETPAE